MAVIPLNITQSETLKAICLITPSFVSTEKEPVMILIDIFSNELFYRKYNEIFPFDHLSAQYAEQLYDLLRKDNRAWETLSDLEIHKALEVYTKVAYGDVAPKLIMQLMN